MLRLLGHSRDTRYRDANPAALSCADTDFAAAVEMLTVIATSAEIRPLTRVHVADRLGQIDQAAAQDLLLRPATDPHNPAHTRIEAALRLHESDRIRSILDVIARDPAIHHQDRSRAAAVLKSLS